MLRTRTVLVATMGVLMLAICALAADNAMCGSGAVAKFNALRLKHGTAPLVEDASLSKAADELAWSGFGEVVLNDQLCKPTFLQTGGTPGSIVWNCRQDGLLSGACEDEGECTFAMDLWTGTYQWVFSETPVKDNLPEKAELAQILWSKATKVGCAIAKTFSCQYFICMFDAPVERTDEALKKYIPPVSSKPDRYEWCPVLASGAGKKLCTDTGVKCHGGSMSMCCPVSCAAASS